MSNRADVAMEFLKNLYDVKPRIAITDFSKCPPKKKQEPPQSAVMSKRQLDFGKPGCRIRTQSVC